MCREVLETMAAEFIDGLETVLVHERRELLAHGLDQSVAVDHDACACLNRTGTQKNILSGVLTRLHASDGRQTGGRKGARGRRGVELPDRHCLRSFEWTCVGIRWQITIETRWNSLARISTVHHGRQFHHHPECNGPGRSSRITSRDGVSLDVRFGPERLQIDGHHAENRIDRRNAIASRLQRARRVR